MIKLLSGDEIRKQDDHRQQQGRQPEKMSQQILGFKSKSKLSLGVIIGSMLSLDLAFILLI